MPNQTPKPSNPRPKPQPVPKPKPKPKPPAPNHKPPSYQAACAQKRHNSAPI